MRLSSVLLILLVANNSVAANEEQFEWLGVTFCHTTVSEVIERYPDATYFEEYELLAVVSSGETLGAVYDDLFFLVLPNGVIAGIQVPIVSGEIEQVIRELDLLATKRWSGTVHKEGWLHSITWISLSSDPGRDIHMHLNENETSPLYNIGYSTDDRKWTVIGLSSASGCDRAHVQQP